MWRTPQRARAEQWGLRGASGGDGVQKGRLRGSCRSPFRGRPGPFPSLRRKQARGVERRRGAPTSRNLRLQRGNLGKGRGPCPAPATAGSRAGAHATNGRQKRAARRRRAGPEGTGVGGLPARSPWARKQRASLSAGVLRVSSHRTSRPDPRGEGPRAVPTQAGRRTREGGRAPRTHLEDQPRHLTRYSSLPCGERRAGGEPRRAPGARGGRAGTHAPYGAACLECTQRRRPARPRCSAPPCRRPPRPAPRRPRPTVAHKAPPPPRPAPRTRVAVARAGLPGATPPIGARGGARIVRGGGGEERSVGLGALCAAWRGCVFRGPWGLTASDHTSPREAIVWVESGEAGSTRRFLPPPARDAAPHQSSISASRNYRIWGGRKIQGWGGEHQKAIVVLFKAIERKKSRSLED